MDYLSLKAAVSEAEGKLSGSKVVDAWQAGKRDVVLAFRRGPGLVLSVDPVRPGLFLLDRGQLPERSPLTFTDLLRARIKGTTLGSIRLPNYGERIVFLAFAATWPAKEGTPLQIVLEVMGRRSNLVLLEEGRILQPLRPVSKDKSPARPVLAGEPYRYPPVREVIPLEEVTTDTLPLLSSLKDADSLYRGVGGLSPYSASQVLIKTLGRVSGEGQEEHPDAGAVVNTLREIAAECTGDKGFLHRTDGKTYLSPFEPFPANDSDQVERFSPFSLAAASWREIHDLEHKEPGYGISHLEQGLLGQLERLNAAMGRVNAEEERCIGHGEIRLMAEALLINTSTAKPGSTSVTLPDPYDTALEITVPLDPVKSPQENANGLFKRARRLKRGLEEVVKRRSSIEGEMAEVRHALEALGDRNDPEPARRLLGSSLREAPKRDRGKKTAYSGPGRRYKVDGFTILVGKSSTDNEKVTFRAGGPNDLWLHARDYPGSHVIILTEKRHVPDKVLYTAAALAAAGSGARNDNAPEIMVTERKWVRKLKGGKPGQVTVEKFRTIRPRGRSQI